MTSKNQTILAHIKNLLKESPVIKAMFEEFKVPIDEMDIIHIEFADLDVSAKTKDRKIYINQDFLKNNKFEEEIHYIVHEVTHYLQQSLGEVKKYKDLHNKDYLDKATELEAFQYQIQFIKEQYGEKRATEYVEDLLDFHELTGKDAEEKRVKLLGE